jgi:hypothetical protein
MQGSQDSIVSVVTRIVHGSCRIRGKTFSFSRTSGLALETTSRISSGYWGVSSGRGMSLTLTAI